MPDYRDEPAPAVLLREPATDQLRAADLPARSGDRTLAVLAIAVALASGLFTLAQPGPEIESDTTEFVVRGAACPASEFVTGWTDDLQPRCAPSPPAAATPEEDQISDPLQELSSDPTPVLARYLHTEAED